jgi:hypothetical protein
MKEVMEHLHKRHEYVAQKYGKPVAAATHAGEGVYLASSLFLSHEIVYYVYGCLFVVWVVHTVVIGFTGE